MKVMDRQRTETIEDIQGDADVVNLCRPGAGLDLPADRTDLDYHEGVGAAIAMLHAGEVTRLEFFELCWEAASGDDPDWVHLGRISVS